MLFAENPKRTTMTQKMKTTSLLVLLAFACLFLVFRYGRVRSDYRPRVIPAVSSTQLTEVDIVPTLDTPLSSSGNAVWCATFKVAWNRACDDVIEGPLQIASAEHVTNRLNSSPVTEVVLPPGDYFAAAGRIKGGIIKMIHRGMAQQFPGVQPPKFAEAVGFVTYGYLDTKATFTTPFVDTKQPLQFVDASATTHYVSGFGLHEGTDWDLREKQSAQIKVLFNQTDGQSVRSRPTAFALDLTADQTEQQVIVAVLPRAEHLRAALDDLTERIEQNPPGEYSAKLQKIDTLGIPNVVFSVDHEFTELRGFGKIIKNQGEFQGLHIERAFQSIRFRLDKSGAAVVSEANIYPAAKPRYFIVDRPFLIVMKQRSTDEPYFVAWIDNTEFLEVNHEPQ